MSANPTMKSNADGFAIAAREARLTSADPQWPVDGSHRLNVFADETKPESNVNVFGISSFVNS
jgi:hypothetical protein